MTGTAATSRILRAAADDPPNSVATVNASMIKVLRHGRDDRLPLQRFDIPAPRGREGFVERVWVIVNSPIVGDDRQTLDVLHQVEDVTEFAHIAGAHGHDADRSATGPSIQRVAATPNAQNRERRERSDERTVSSRPPGSSWAASGATPPPRPTCSGRSPGTPVRPCPRSPGDDRRGHPLRRRRPHTPA